MRWSPSEQLLSMDQMNGCTYTFTVAAIVLILVWQLTSIATAKFQGFASKFFSILSYHFRSERTIAVCLPLQSKNLNIPPNALSQQRISGMISDSDLKALLDDLDEKLHENDEWDNVVDRSNNFLSYNAKCCKPKDGPLKYISVTVFESCSTKMLRDFYMDNDYRKQWDKTLVVHKQLQVDENTGIEIGQTIKKFPLLTPREYIVAWRVWVGKDGTFYCLSKGCEHSLAPRHRKYIRVEFFRSGWRIRKVPGRNACEIKMVHQEDAGMNVEMAKLAFAKGIWSYVCRMDNALRKYFTIYSSRPTPAVNAITFIQKVPPELDAVNSLEDNPGNSGICSEIARKKDLKRRPSNKMIANGMILLGGVICLSRGNSNLGAKVAMAYILSKLTKHATSSIQTRPS